MGEKLNMTCHWPFCLPLSLQGNEVISPLHYHHNNKAWVTGAESKTYLSWLNNNMVVQDQHILTFMDNVPGHPNLSFCNKKLDFLPPNTTTRFQPHNTGIMTRVEAFYKKSILCFTLYQKDWVVSVPNAAEGIQIYSTLNDSSWPDSR